MPTTHWSLVGRAGQEDEATRRKALVTLLERYHPAIRSYLLHRKRLSDADADDLVQGFLMSKVLEADLLPRAQQQKGRFRTFLLTSLDRYIVSEHRKATAKKRSSGEAAMEVDENLDAQSREPAPDAALDVPWARQVIADVVERMKAECKASGRADVWGVFEARILAPITGDAPEASYDDLVKKYGLKSPAQASNVLITAKRMFVRILRGVVGEYAKDEEDIDREIAELYQVLAQGRSAMT